MVNDKSPNWAELYMLNKTAEAAILSGELDELRNANASTFHVLSIYLMDLNARLGALENGQKPGMAYAQTATDQSVASGIILESE